MDGTVVVAAIGLITTASAAIVGPLILERRKAAMENRRERLKLAVQLALSEFSRASTDCDPLGAPTASLAGLVTIHFRSLGLIEDAKEHRRADQASITEILRVREEAEQALYSEQLRVSDPGA
jgi:hypothetical protein